jgi:hypothetical protein
MVAVTFDFLRSAPTVRARWRTGGVVKGMEIVSTDVRNRFVQSLSLR